MDISNGRSNSKKSPKTFIDSNDVFKKVETLQGNVPSNMQVIEKAANERSSKTKGQQQQKADDLSKTKKASKALSCVEALNLLDEISKCSKKISEVENDNVRQDSATPAGNKRLRDAENEREAAATSKKRSKHLISKKVRKQVETMSKEELSDLIAENVVDLISSRSELGELRRRCDVYAATNEKWKKKTGMLLKMIADLNVVVRRFVLEAQNGKKEPAPVKITRSVGIQISQISSVERRRVSSSMSSPPLVINLDQQSPQEVFKTNTTSQTTTPQPTTSRTTTSQPTTSPSTKNGRKSFENLKEVKAAAISSKTQTGGYKAEASTTSFLNLVNTNSNNNNDCKNDKAIEVVDLDDDDDASNSAPDSIKARIPIPNWSIVKPSTSVSSTSPATNSTSKSFTLAATSDPIGLIPTSGPNRFAVKNPPAPGQNRSIVLRPMAPGQSGRLAFGDVVNAVFKTPQFPPGSRLATANRHFLPQFAALQPRLPNQPLPRLVAQGGSRPALRIDHPAPLPELNAFVQVSNPDWKKLPPKPKLNISKLSKGIVLSWSMDYEMVGHAAIATYQIYSYQEASGVDPNPELWKKVGAVKALTLPMACTLTDFCFGRKYYFAVRAEDVHSRVGLFSDPKMISP